MKKILFLILSITLLKSIQSMEYANSLSVQSNKVNSYVIGIPVTAPINTMCKHISLMLQKPDQQSEHHYINLVSLTLPFKILPSIQAMLIKYSKQLESFAIDMAPRVIRKENELYWYPNTKNKENLILSKVTLEILCQLQIVPLNPSDYNQPINPHIAFDDIEGESYNVLVKYLSDDTFSTKFIADRLALIEINETTGKKIVIMSIPFQIGMLQTLSKTILNTWQNLRYFLDATNS